MDAIREFFAQFGTLGVFLISMLPVIELRGAIPVGVGLGLPLLETYIIAVLGNILPVPFILLFAKYFLNLFSKLPKIGFLFQKMLDKGHKVAASLGEKGYFALILFVAIPLPGTGAWTGSLAAALLDLSFWKTVAAVSLGVVCAGVIMAALSLGVFSFIRI